MRNSIIFMLSFAYFVAAAEAVPTYRIRDLGDLGGGEGRSFASNINNAGWIVGQGNSAAGPRAVLWKRKPDGTYQLINLGVLSGHNLSNAYGINATNVIVGSSSFTSGPFGHKGVRWIPQINGTYVIKDLGTLGPDCDVLGFNYGVQAFAINNAGWIVGGSDQCPFVWKPGIGMVALFVDVGNAVENLVDINSSKRAVGTSVGPPGCCGPVPVAWNTVRRTVVALPGDDNDGGTGYAEGINDKGWIVGQLGWYFLGCCDTEAVLWKPKVGGGYTRTVLGPLEQIPGTITNQAVGLDINFAGAVVGRIQVSDPITEKAVKTYAFYWDATSGFFDLNDLVAASDPLKGKFKLVRANAINDKGRIVGFGITAAKKLHGFLLTPQ